MIKTTDYISFTIDRLPKGYVFTYADFITDVNRKEAVIKALNRMVGAGKIAKLSKGRFYKPEISPFGQLQPDQEQVVKDLLSEDGKITGYLTGYSIFNQLGLTTQVSNTIQIGKNQIRPNFKRDRYTISFIRQKNTITKENVPLLQILDTIRLIKKVPDATIESSCERLLVILNNVSIKEKITIVRLALRYQSGTKALLGALLDEKNTNSLSEPLYKSLNPITTYKFTGADKVLSFAGKWNIR